MYTKEQPLKINEKENKSGTTAYQLLSSNRFGIFSSMNKYMSKINNKDIKIPKDA